MKSQKNQRKFVRLAIIGGLVFAVFAVGIGYFVWQNIGKEKAADTKTTSLNQGVQQECEKQNDKDVCRFIASWKLSKQYRITATISGNKSTMEIDGDKKHMKTEGEIAYEVITIGDTAYTKAGDTWYKQTRKTDGQSPTGNNGTDLNQTPGVEAANPAAISKNKYKLIGKEACGNLQCFKYEVLGSGNGTSNDFIWFDDKDYKLRKTLSQSSGASSEITIEYDNITISAPSPVKELAADEYIMPGQTVPTKMPSGR